MSPERRLFWFRRLALLGALLAASVVVLGAWVRLTDAGLGCPDWPGCYGHLYPKPGAEVAKAWHEMVHRYAAGTLIVIIFSLLLWATFNRKSRSQPLLPVACLFVVVCMQGALGALTVTQLLKPLIVTGHLFGGLTTLALLCWLAITPERRTVFRGEPALRRFAIFGCGVLILQLFLGGWTSTNYAAVACPDFPTCQRSWWPPMDFSNGFVLWRGLGIDYEGGILANPARMAIHFTHRMGAVVAGLVLFSLGVAAGRSAVKRVWLAGRLLAVAVVLQITIGIATVHYAVPLPLATLHNAGAALLVVSMVLLLRALRPVAPLASSMTAVVVPLPRGIHPA